MAELVGSALLSAFFNVLFDKLATQEVLSFLRPKKVINKLLMKLKVLLLCADKLLDDAEEKLIYDPRVEQWHDKLKDVVYKANELADKIETEALRRKLEGHQSAKNPSKMFTKLFSKNSFDNYVKDELEVILSSLEHLLSLKDALGLEPAGTGRSNYSGVTPAERFRFTPVVDESEFCGREDIKETIIQSLRSADVGGDKVSVIPVIGPGGIGKTTLVQIIYDHPQVKQLFGEVRAWVTVSTEFDLPVIAKKIIRKFSSSSQMDGDDDQQELLFKLRDVLKRKKFLLVLDDVWSEDRDEWNMLKSCFRSGERGSKIIVTTRSSRVASIAAPNQPHHFLQELPREDCLRLFETTVFTGDQDRDANPDLQEIGQKIVEKCKGHPLSVKSLGGFLHRERDPKKWESILKSSMWELLQQNSRSIIPSLWLSYRYLPSEIKPCFAYCSIFPKDYRFKKEELVRLWMAEGFLKNEAGEHGITMEEVGERYLEELISRSLFQRSSDSHDEETIMMNDLVHDLAMYVSEKFCFWLDEDRILSDLARETRHLSYNLAIEDVKKFEGLSKAKRLLSFVGLQPSTRFIDEGELDILKVLEELSIKDGCLRVLSLSSSYKMKSLPNSIGNLKHLRYLNLSGTLVTELPDSLGTLYNLQTLLLSSCRNLIRLPGNMRSLINLRHLDTRYSPLEEMPPEMCELKELQTLTDFVLGEQSGSSIRDLGVLHNLHGRLRVSGLQNVYSVQDALNANLKDKKNLSELVLEWEGTTGDSEQEREVLDALQPYASLEKLIISEYGGRSFPLWVGDSLFSKIETMHLNNCKDGLFLPALGRLPSLKELKIQGSHRVETIGDEFYGNDSVFRSLEVLHFYDMPEWRRWSFIEDDKDGVFPHLKELRLHSCPKLVGGLPNSNTLLIDSCENLEFPGNHHYSSLESLKITKSCDSLKSLQLDYFPKLNMIDLSGCQNFESFTFSEEPPLVLESLTLQGLPKFVSFPEGGLPAPNLKDLYIRECENLRSLPQQMHSLGSLEILKVENCPEIESFPEGGFPSTIEQLWLWKCTKLTPHNTCIEISKDRLV